jgi:hypothetical protein
MQADFAQAALDDVEGDGAAVDGLLAQQGAGINVAPIGVITAQPLPQILQSRRIERSTGIRCGNRIEFAGRDDAIAAKEDFMDQH